MADARCRWTFRLKAEATEREGIVKLRFAVVGLLLLPQAAPRQNAQVVGIEMRNVRLHVADDAILEVRLLRGRLRSNSANPPVFDDQRSFVMEVEDGEFSIDAPSLTALVNRAFDYKGSALSNVRVSFEDGRLVQHGTLKKGISVPFSIVASVAATPDGLINVHPVKVKAAGVPSGKLMSLFGVELDEIVKSRPDRGITFRDNDLFLDPSRMLPPPETHGKLTKVFVRGDRLVQVFGRGAPEGAKGPGGNYIWFRGGAIRFGKLTMSDADLKLIDMDPKDPFDFHSARYNDQLVAGYSKNTPDKALRTYMPDFNDLRRAPRKPSTPAGGRSSDRPKAPAVPGGLPSPSRPPSGRP